MYAMTNIKLLDTHYDALLINKEIELDLRRLCGKFVIFNLKDYTVTSNHESVSVNKILDYFQSRLNIKHKKDKGFYRSV